MKESSFIDQNKEKWEEFESLLKKKEQDPRKMSRLFVQVTDDLAYARTYFKNRFVRVYLNEMAQVLFRKIYRNKRSTWAGIGKFWKTELPVHLYEGRRAMLISFLVFIGSVAIGVLSSIQDPDFLTYILGDEYVTMTDENIAKDDPMAVYKDHAKFDMFLGITINNLMVATNTFVLGLFAGVGSILFMIINGVMLGAFQFYFFQKGIYLESILTIWQHGTLEISAIIIAGGAGITMGRGMVFPGTYTRGMSFRRSGVRGLKILLGISPIIIIAGFIEGFLTRYTETPDLIRIALIVVSLGFILIYYWWYPRYVYRNLESPPEDVLVEKVKQKANYDTERIQTNGSIFNVTFQSLFKTKRKLIAFNTLMALCYALVMMADNKILDVMLSSESDYFTATLKFVDYSGNPILMLFNSVLLLMVIGRTSYLMNKAIINPPVTVKGFIPFLFSNLFKLLLAVLIFIPMLLMPTWLAMISVLFFTPFVLMGLQMSISENINFLKAFMESFQMIGKSFELVIWNTMRLYFLAGLLFLLVVSPLYSILKSVLLTGIYIDSLSISMLLAFITTFLLCLIMVFLLNLLTFGNAFGYFSAREKSSSINLIQRIKRFETLG